MKLKSLVIALAVGLGAVSAFAQASGPVKIGFITDMSSLYADIDGPAGGEMIKWAAQDFGGKVRGEHSTRRQPDQKKRESSPKCVGKSRRGQRAHHAADDGADRQGPGTPP